MAKQRLGPWQWEVVTGGRREPPFNVVYVLKDLPFQATKRYTGVVVDMKRTFRIAPDEFNTAWRLDLYDFATWEGLTREEYRTPQEAAMALDKYLKGENRFSKNADAGARIQVTIYQQGPMGSIGKVEGYLTSVSTAQYGGGVNYIPKGGRRERMIMTYYSSFIMVVEGWNKPDPGEAWIPMESDNPNLSVSRGKYRGTDPRWVSDFMEGPGKSLRPIVLFERGHLVKDVSGVAKEGSVQVEASPGKPISVWDRVRVDRMRPFGWASPAAMSDGSVPSPWRVAHADQALAWLKGMSHGIDDSDLYTTYESDLHQGHLQIFVGLRNNRSPADHSARLQGIFDWLQEMRMPVLPVQYNGRLSGFYLVDDLKKDVLRGKAASLRQATIRLAQEHGNLRPLLLSLLRG